MDGPCSKTENTEWVVERVFCIHSFLRMFRGFNLKVLFPVMYGLERFAAMIQYSVFKPQLSEKTFCNNSLLLPASFCHLFFVFSRANSGKSCVVTFEIYIYGFSLRETEWIRARGFLCNGFTGEIQFWPCGCPGWIIGFSVQPFFELIKIHLFVAGWLLQSSLSLFLTSYVYFLSMPSFNATSNAPSPQDVISIPKDITLL